MVRIAKNALDSIFHDFPSLEHDGVFDVLDYPDLLYNCIAFAMGTDQMWVSPYRDAPWVWWPDTCPFDQHPDSLKQAFISLGFEECYSATEEADYDKVVLYKKDDLWQHASRLHTTGICHSKLGESWKIQHNSGDVFAGSIYGEIYAYMRRPIKDSHKTIDSIPQRIAPTVDRRLWGDIVNRVRQQNKAVFPGYTALYHGSNNSKICAIVPDVITP